MRFFALLLYLSPLFCSMALAEKVEFTFAYDVQEGFPSFIGNGTKIPEENPGTYVDILRLVEERIPIQLKLVRLPWERCKAYLKLNKVDGINSSYRANRNELGIFPLTPDKTIDTSKRISSDTYRLYAKKGNAIRYDPLAERIIHIGKGVLAPMGYSIIDDMHKKGIAIEKHSGGVLGIMKMLSLNRASGVIAHENQANHILKQHASTLADIVPVNPPIAEKHYYILISKAFYKKHPAIAEQIWRVIGELRESHLPELIEKYMQTEY